MNPESLKQDSERSLPMDNSKIYDVVLVQMPYYWPGPSLALALLKSDMNARGIKSRIRHSNLYFRDLIKKQPDNYFVKHFLSKAAWKWEYLFSAFTPFKPAASPEERILAFANDIKAAGALPVPFDDYTAALNEGYSEFISSVGEFLEREAEIILSMKPAVVGFSITTEQRNASFAMCRLLKEKNPDIITVVGGGFCDEEIAGQLLRCIPDIDYVYTGEGDGKFAEGMELILAGKEDELCEEIPYFCSRTKSCAAYILEDLNQAPVPDYDDYIEDLRSVQYAKEAEFVPVIEGSRGCFWGEKGRCRFCGLHYIHEGLKYREKEPERVWKEIDCLAEKYQAKEFVFSDCIMSRRFIAQLPDNPPENRKDYVFFTDCRTDLTLNEMKKLKANGFTKLQPGIEAIQDDILKHMNKGATALKQIGFLKNAAICGINCRWTIICGLPGEKNEWWTEMLEIMKKIHHLPPPRKLTNMMLSRGSEFDLHFDEFTDTEKKIFPLFAAAMPDDEEFVRKTSDWYMMPGVATDPLIFDALFCETEKWKADFYAGSSLFYRAFSDNLVIYDKRSKDDPSVYFMSGLEKEVFMLTDSPVSIDMLKSRIKERSGAKEDLSEIDRILKEMEEKNLLIRTGNRVLNLALPG